MNKAEIVQALKENFEYEAREELQKEELELILEAHQSREIIADMQEEVETATESAKKDPGAVVCKIGKEKYAVCPGGAKVPGLGSFTASQIAENKDVQKAILAIKGQQILTSL